MNIIEKLIKKIQYERVKYNLPIPEPLTEEGIDDFEIKFKQYFNIAPPVTHLSFLRICNGLENNGFIIYSANNKNINDVLYGIFENNKLWHDLDPSTANFVYFAESGQDIFILNKNTQQFELRDRYNGEVVEVFKSVDEMLEYILKLMIV